MILRSLFLPRPRPLRHDDRRNPPSWTKIPLDLGPHWTRPSHHILEYAVHNIFLKNPQISVGLQILLEGFQFQATLVRRIPDREHAKIGQSGLWADGGELRIVHDDFIS